MRYNLKDHFEEIYLRTKMLRRFLLKGAVNAPINETKFKCRINYLTTKFFRQNKLLLTLNGFEYDDVYSIVKLFGITYFGLPNIPSDRHTQYNYMVYFINQRLSRLMHWIARKFAVPYISEIINDDACQALYMTRSDIASNWYYKLMSLPYGDSVDDGDRLKILYWQLDLINAQLSHLRQHSKPNVELRHQYIQQQQQIQEQIDRLRTRNDNTVTLQQLKQRFAANPMKYKSQLVHYATAHNISHELRRAARRYCKRYNIDYQSYIDTNKNTNNRF